LVFIIEGVGSIWFWMIIFGVFLVDATFTLLRRFIRRRKWYEAHRTHAYQHAARRWGHMRVTVAVSIINVAWLLPIAYYSNMHRDLGPLFALLALSPLVVLVFVLEAGLEKE
jgi:Fuc2NAc and GlcNAc transferase